MTAAAAPWARRRPAARLPDPAAIRGRPCARKRPATARPRQPPAQSLDDDRPKASPPTHAHAIIANQIAAATLCRRPLARGLSGRLGPLFQQFEPAFGLRPHVLRRRAAVNLAA